MLRPLETLGALLGSGWVFYFRFPSFSLKQFDSKGILLGPWLQGGLVLALFALFERILPGAFAGFLGVFAILALSLLMGFFHEDGLADVADSIGVSKFGPEAEAKIQAAMKDSRLGSFGVSALVILWLFRWQVSQSHLLDMWAWGLAVFASRATGLGIAICGQSFWAGLGSKKVSGALAEIPLGWAGATLFLGLAALPAWSFWLHPDSVVSALVVSVGLGVGTAAGLSWLVRRTGGFGGDMAGAVICINETVLLLYALSRS